MPTSPLDEYRSRLDARRATHLEFERADARLSHARLAAVAAAAVVAILAWRGAWSWFTLIVPVAGFVALAVRHDHVIRAKRAAARAVTFYERGLARIEDRWAGGGETGDRFRDDGHLYANDLDLFGRGSLFELLSIARTGPGETRLATWLKIPADPGEILARHEAARELAPALDLREAVSLAGSDVGTAVDGESLVAWAQAPPAFTRRWIPGVAIVLTAALLASVTAWALTGVATPLIVMVCVQLVFWNVQREWVGPTLHAAGGRARDLDVLSRVLVRIESATLVAPVLQRLHRALAAPGSQASAAIARLHRLLEMHDWAHNMIFAPVAVVVMWDLHIAVAIEGWRRRHGARIATWLDAVGDFEALSSIAAYHYEHPADPFPDVVTVTDAGAPGPGAVFDGVGLGHPLLPLAHMVRNDVCLDARTRLLVISGSNMSGKSTLLRTVGINAVLALAGAPVRATSLRISPVSIGATLRIQDSLQEGRSRFYAEVSRIRGLADQSRGPLPLLFLLDELFNGTNSHDRLIGATGVLRSLIEHGAIGLITTHDLALTAIADQLAPQARNVHFEDWFERGELTFDYLMKPGPVTRSNAIALMRAVGLDVGE